MERRSFIGGTLSVATLAAVSKARAAAETVYDYVIIGAGTGGLPAAIFALRRGAKVLLLDAAQDVGGTLHVAFGQISGAGTVLQKAKGIVDSPDRHFDDVMRLSNNLADRDVVRLCVDNAPATLDWLLNKGLVALPDHPVTGESPGRPGYSVPRYLWGANAGKDILTVIRKELAPEVASGRVTIMLDTRASKFLVSGTGAVEGVRAVTGGTVETDYRGRHVILATGAYSNNPNLFEKLLGGPAYVGAANPFALGDGLEMVTAIGGTLRGHELHRPGSGSILSGDRWPARAYSRFNITPSERLPWEIYVNNLGQRYVREDDTSSNARELELRKQPAFRYAIVFDDAILNESPPGIAGWDRDRIRSHFDTHSMFKSAPTIEALARKAGVDAAGLVQTVKDYNAGVKSGKDPFGRTHMPRPIAKAPFYAIIHHGSSATSSVGVVVDKELRVTRADGKPVPNLYAIGEVLGSGVTLGNAFTPGMMLTPALTFGKLLGERLSVG